MLQPESVLGASFQLSFAAVLALMVVYEAWRCPRSAQTRAPTAWAAGAVLAYFVGVW